MLKEPAQSPQVNSYHGCHVVDCKHCDDCDDAFLRGQANHGVAQHIAIEAAIAMMLFYVVKLING